MAITLIGWFAIIGGIITFLDPTRLLYLFAALTPFTASSIVIIPGSVFGLQPSFFLAALFNLRMVFKLLTEKVVITRTQGLFLGAIGLFWLLSLISLFNPIILSYLGLHIRLLNPVLYFAADGSVYQDYSFTNFIYFTLFIVTIISVMFEVDTMKKLAGSVRVLLVSGFLTALWGILVQFPSFFLKYQYPFWLFNNHQGYGQAWMGRMRSGLAAIPKICSVAPEASMYAYFAMMMVALLAVLIINKYKLFGKTLQNLIMLSLVIVSWLTTSTTAFAGYGFLVLLMLALFWNNRKMFSLRIDTKMWFMIKLGLAAALLFVGVFILVSYFFKLNLAQTSDIIRLSSYDKLSTGSGQTRFGALQRGIEILFSTYLLGTGWGSNRTTELYSTLLANIGLAGFASFIFLLWLVIRQTLLIARRNQGINNSLAVMSQALLGSFLMSLFLLGISIPDFIYTYFWLIFGLLLALPRLEEKK